MNTLKGFIFSDKMIYLKSCIEPKTWEYLLTIHQPESEEIETTQKDKLYTERLQQLFKRDKNFKFLPIFQRSPYIDHNDWQGSYTNYLKMLETCSLSINSDIEFIKRIKDTLDYALDSDIVENARNESIKDLNMCLTFVSTFGSTFDTIASESSYNLEALIFIDKLNENTTEVANGTGFWFNNIDTLACMSIYQIQLKKQNTALFDDDINNVVASRFIKVFADVLETSLEEYDNEEFDNFIKPIYNLKITSYDRIDIKPLFYFGTQDKMEMFSHSNHLSSEQKANLINLSLTSEVVQEQLYNRSVKPKLTLIYFKQNNDGYLMIQKSNQDSSLGALYKVSPGDQMFSEMLSINEEIFNKYLSGNIVEIEEEFITSIQDKFILQNLKNK